MTQFDFKMTSHNQNLSRLVAKPERAFPSLPIRIRQGLRCRPKRSGLKSHLEENLGITSDPAADRALPTHPCAVAAGGAVSRERLLLPGAVIRLSNP